MDDLWDDVKHQSSTFWHKVKLFWWNELWPKIYYVLLHLAEAVLEVIPESFRFFLTAIQLFGTVFGLFVASALLIICALVIFFGTNLVYGMLKDLVYIINKVIGMVSAGVGGVTSVINSVDHVFGGHSHVHVHIPKLNICSLLPGVCDALRLPHYCAPYQSVWGEFGLFFKVLLNFHTCPIWRWSYFTKGYIVSLYSHILPWLIGWSSYDPNPNGNNCRETKFASACMYIMLGYLLLALFYIAIGGAIVTSFRGTIFNLIEIAVMIPYWICVGIFELFMGRVYWIVDSVARYKKQNPPPRLSAVDKMFLRHMSRVIQRQNA